MFHLNARSLVKNFDEFQVLLSSINYDFSFIAISETWFKPSTPFDLFNIDGYYLVQVCRQAQTGGGVELYV